MIQRVYLVVLVLLLACTNPFSTRDPETPQRENSGSVYDQAVDPEIVLVNFSRALEQKNVDQYMQCFPPRGGESPHPFTFRPEPYFVNEFVDHWTLSEELNFFNQLVSAERSTYPRIRFNFLDSLSLRPITPTAVNDSVETNSLQYQLEVTVSPDSSAVYKGTAVFKLYREEQAPELWHIYYWQDNAINQAYTSTWTYLKLFINKSR